MAFQKRFGDQRSRGDFQRRMFQGDWKCATCGTPITELPFEPREDQPVYCRDCFKGSGQRSRNDFPRQAFQGDWTCAGCGAKITELPFQPTPDRPVYCRDCHRQYRESSFNR